MKTIFMGNHTVGVLVLNVLLKMTEVQAVFAHPPHPDDGALYRSVKQTAEDNGIPVFQFGGKRNEELLQVLRHIVPDLIVVADYRYLLTKDVLGIPRLGAINFHPSLLPLYRGRAPVNWAMINGETDSGLTVHYIDEGMDTGDIIAQETVAIDFEDTIYDVHEKLFPVYTHLAEEVIVLFQRGGPPRTLQDHTKATVFPQRKPEDGLIDWSRSSRDLYNFIRAITYPYPGAFTFLSGKKYIIWSSRPVAAEPSEGGGAVPGKICGIAAAGIQVKTGDGMIAITQIEDPEHKKIDSVCRQLKVGQIFSARA